VALVDQASRGCDDRDDALSVIVQKDAGILDLMGFHELAFATRTVTRAR
jgi:hypothetical protein